MKYLLQSNVCKLAHFITKTYKVCLSDAFKLAWKNVKLKNKLHKGGVNFCYLTKTGFHNQVFGTLKNIDHLFNKEIKINNNPRYCHYYDLGKRGFRTFEINKLISVEF